MWIQSVNGSFATANKQGVIKNFEFKRQVARDRYESSQLEKIAIMHQAALTTDSSKTCTYIAKCVYKYSIL